MAASPSSQHSRHLPPRHSRARAGFAIAATKRTLVLLSRCETSPSSPFARPPPFVVLNGSGPHESEAAVRVAKEEGVAKCDETGTGGRVRLLNALGVGGAFASRLPDESVFECEKKGSQHP